MRKDQPLRFYAKPVKLLPLLIASAILVAVSIRIPHDPRERANQVNVVIAWLAIGFFGVVFLIVL
jgi:hypothetical protein